MQPYLLRIPFMVAISPVQFRQKALSVLENDEEKKPVRLSAPQEKILLAAYGIYAREVGRKSDVLKDEISDLRVESEQKETEIVREQARTAIASMWNHETAKQLGNFLVTPISDWGRSNGQSQPELLLIDGTAEGIDGEGTVGDVLIVPDEVRDGEPEGGYRESLDRMPWFLWVPTSILTRIFGGLSPLSFALLLMAVVAGAVIYGNYARSVWKDQYDAEVVANGGLRSQIESKNAEINTLLNVRGDNEQLELELADLQRRFDLEKDARETVDSHLDGAMTEFAEYRAETAEKHSQELQRFQSDATAASAQREREQTAQIAELQLSIVGLERENLAFEQRVTELQSNYSSASDAEGELQTRLQVLFDEHRELTRSHIEISGELTDLQTVNRVLSGIPSAVNKYFWHPEGLLEIRRACFRLFYTEQLARHSDKLVNLSIPDDMANARYDLETDPRRIIDRCSDY